MKKLIPLLILALAVVAAGWLLFLDRAASPPRDDTAIERVDDHPLYVMHLNED